MFYIIKVSHHPNHFRTQQIVKVHYLKPNKPTKHRCPRPRKCR